MAGRGGGRGRGRGALMFQSDATETKPGANVQGKEEDTLATMIKSLSIEPDDIELMPVSDTAKKYCKSKNEIELLVNMLYARCTKDWQFARCATQLCLRIMDIQAQHESFRTHLLQTIQKDFKGREEIRSSDHAKFLGCLSFLFQVFAIVRDNKGGPLEPLLAPVVIGLEMLLDDKANNDEISCAASHLVDLCPLLHKLNDNMKNIQLMNIVKDKIVSNSGSRESRYQLIFAVEKFAILKATNHR